MNTLVFRFLNSTIKCPVLDWVLPLFSDKDVVVIPGLVAVILLAYFGGRRLRTCLVSVALALLVADVGCEKVLKNVFEVKRPYAVLEGVNLYRNNEWLVYNPQWYALDRRQSHSFPSTHASNIAVVAVAVALFRRRTLWVTLPLALLVGLSRIYTGNHFPSDVLAGYLWGGLCAVGMTALAKWAVARIWGPPAIPEKTIPLSPERKAFFWLLGLWTCVNFAYVCIGRFDLVGDEAQYWDWSRQLALGYYSKPPLIAYIIAAFTHAGGHKEWAIRSGAVLFSSATLALVYALTLRIAARAEGGRLTPRAENTGLLAVCVMLAMPASWVGSVLMTIDPAMVFFWVLAMYSFHRAVGGERGYWWLVGAALGLGILAKYTVFTLAISFFLYLLLVDRRPLRSFGPYLALCIMLVLMAGVVYWNAANDWVSVRHTAAIGAGGGFSPGKALSHFFKFLGGQLGVVSPILFGMFLWALWLLRKRFKTSPDAAFLFLCFIVLFGFYVLISFTRKSEPNWPVAAYMAAAPAFAWIWNERPRGRRARRLLAAGVILGCAIGIFPRTTDAFYFVGSAFTKPSASPDRLHLFGLSIDPDKDPTNQLVGGRELGMELSRLLAESHGTPPFLFSNRYQLTAWEAFYTKGHPRAYCINIGDRRLNQYDLWGGWDELKGRDALFVTGWDETKASLYVGGLVQNGIFESGECVRIVRVYRCKTCVRQFTICRFHNFKGNLPEPPVGSY